MLILPNSQAQYKTYIPQFKIGARIPQPGPSTLREGSIDKWTVRALIVKAQAGPAVKSAAPIPSSTTDWCAYPPRDGNAKDLRNSHQYAGSARRDCGGQTYLHSGESAYTLPISPALNHVDTADCGLDEIPACPTSAIADQAAAIIIPAAQLIVEHPEAPAPVDLADAKVVDFGYKFGNIGLASLDAESRDAFKSAVDLLLDTALNFLNSKADSDDLTVAKEAFYRKVTTIRHGAPNQPSRLTGQRRDLHVNQAALAKRADEGRRLAKLLFDFLGLVAKCECGVYLDQDRRYELYDHSAHDGLRVQVTHPRGHGWLASRVCYSAQELEYELNTLAVQRKQAEVLVEEGRAKWQKLNGQPKPAASEKPKGDADSRAQATIDQMNQKRDGAFHKGFQARSAQVKH